jgi:hypothetical protein
VRGNPHALAALDGLDWQTSGDGAEQRQGDAGFEFEIDGFKFRAPSGAVRRWGIR